MIIIKKVHKSKIIPHTLKKETDILSTLIKYDLCKHVVGHFRNCRLSDDGGSVLSTVFADKTQHVFERKASAERIAAELQTLSESALLVCFLEAWEPIFLSLDWRNKNTMLLRVQ